MPLRARSDAAARCVKPGNKWYQSGPPRSRRPHASRGRARWRPRLGAACKYTGEAGSASGRHRATSSWAPHARRLVDWATSASQARGMRSGRVWARGAGRGRRRTRNGGVGTRRPATLRSRLPTCNDFASRTPTERGRVADSDCAREEHSATCESARGKLGRGRSSDGVYADVFCAGEDETHSIC